MASSPPFHVEDQTDEDFFDKLVDDDLGSTEASSSSVMAVKFSDANDSDDAKAFANLSIGEYSGREAWLNEENVMKDTGAANITGLSCALLDGDNDDDPSVVASELVGYDTGGGINPQHEEPPSFSASETPGPDSGSGFELKNEVPGGAEEAVSASDSAGASKCNGSGGSGVKEVGWSSFCADSSASGMYGFGSYSDFFSELGQDSEDFLGTANGGGEIASFYAEQNAIGLGNSDTCLKYDAAQVYSNPVDPSAYELDWNTIQYWESMYPGYKYDPATGQWYQVDGYGTSTSAQCDGPDSSSYSGCASNENSNFSYLRQSGQTVVGTLAMTNAAESVASWNQALQVNNGYPEHMIFDPGYPGWYYDMTAQEWRALDSDNQAAHSTVIAHNHQNQNGYASVSMYLNNGTGGVFSEDRLTDNQSSQVPGSQSKNSGWAESYNEYNGQSTNMWQPETLIKSETVGKSTTISSFGENQQVDGFYGSMSSINNHADQRMTVQQFSKTSQGRFDANGISGVQTFVPSMPFSQPFNSTTMPQAEQMSFSNDFPGSQQSVLQEAFQRSQQLPYAPSTRISPDGRPPHAIVTFGFGGKLVVMKDNNYLQNSSLGSQGPVASSISVLNLMEVVAGNANASGAVGRTFDYFGALCHQSFPGPLVGGHVSSKDLHKWIDERIAACGSPEIDHRRGELLRLLFSLLKIACQHYGKLRSPFGADTTLKETDTPESAVAKLFASAKKNGMDHSSLTHCLQHIPSEGQMQETAITVQNLLVSGRRVEALQRAQDGQLWGPALIIAAQLGEQFYVETVKQMALQQLAAGTPLRTLCLLIAGQPAEVFSSNNSSDSGPSGFVNMSQNHAQLSANSMLDDWEENLAVITANRTKDDELVITHLGDSLLKERSNIIAAHICYLVAETNFEPYSDTSRLCLLGADHWRFPRTYASPEAIQRTELYEYSKVLGNSQFILLPFQPYKLLYAYMLAEIGRVSDALKYCQAVSKSLKTGRAAEAEVWKQLVLSLEDRIRIHQQGGYAVNLAPAKLVGKLLNFFDTTAHRVVGGLPPPAPSATHGNVPANENHHHHQIAPRVSSSQSTMTMSSLMSSASMEPISAWAGDGDRMIVHNRSVSEPDFGRTPLKDQVDSSKLGTTDGGQGKESGAGAVSRLGRFSFGSQLLQKTVGLVLGPRSNKQAKLGESNKFYYDEKLKRWVEEGAETPAEEAALPPPPTTAAFQNGTSAGRSEMSPGGGSPNFSSATSSEGSLGVPPIPSGSNQFSARGRIGVRARYVDTFNRGRSNSANMFQSPSIPSVKPPQAANAKFFIPAPVPNDQRQGTQAIEDTVPEESSANESPSPSTSNQTFQTPISAMTMQRFPSMDQIRRSGSASSVNGPLSGHARRTASWGGSFDGSFSLPEKTETKSLGESLNMPPSSFMPSPLSGSGSGDDLHEVEL